MEPVETIDIFDESPTYCDNAVQTSQPMELGEGTTGPLTAQISPNFRFRTDGINMERIPESNQRTPTRPTAQAETERTPPTTTPGKRKLFAISPVKQVSRKRANEESPQSIIFCDFETSGLFKHGSASRRTPNLFKSRCPSDFASELEKLVLETQKDAYPKILELSFVAVARETFEKSIRKMEDLRKQPGATTLRVRVPCNIHTRQINPQMSGTEWQQYDLDKKNHPLALVHEKNDLHLKNGFDVEWKQVRAFLDSCPKPACLVAHNGLYFDYRVLHGELARYNLLETQALPNGILFIDSYLAIQHIEDSFKQRLSQILQGIDWSLISHLAVSDEVIEVPASGIPVDHPLNFLNKCEWPTALFSRFTANDFKKSLNGKWEFSPSDKPSYSLKALYETTIGGGFDFHYAQDDSEGLLQICLAYGKEFLDYIDTVGTEMPF